ncbi:tRNA 2-thiocytidine(32) synthetase TtcA [Gammaproteobacteria bacterium]|nr:tRNA 2-thiocytidine(32) synthetase TtcA [Gammaproteobacteria bacterium]
MIAIPYPRSHTDQAMAKASVEHNKLNKKLRRLVGRAVVDHSMIEEGDRVMVCLSGGKDSYTMLDVLRSLQRNAPVHFTLFALNLDQKQPGFPSDVLPRYLDELDVEYHIVEEDTYSIVKDLTPEGKTYCPICSRLRRGILYSRASALGATKIALGHHLDDAVETLFLNMFFGGKLKSMPPKLLSDDGAHVVIRPLYYVRERDVARYSKYREHPIIPCRLCGSQENMQRQVVKDMCKQWDEIQPGRVENIARAMRNVVPSHLADPELFNFSDLEPRLRLLPISERIVGRH